MIPPILGTHLPRGIHLRPGDVAVHIDAAWHDDEAPRINSPRRSYRRISWRRDDFSAADPQVANCTCDVVGGIVNLSASQ